MPRFKDRDLKMMNLICEKETSLVAEEIGMTAHAINNRFDWIRDKIEECQQFLNTAYAYQKKCPDLKRRLTPTTKHREIEPLE
jgi:hypothetical protein